MSLHSFDPLIAARVGLNAAVLYQNIVFWTEKNAANGKHFYDGYYWTYNSVAAFSELFPYLSIRQIRTGLQKLIDEKLIAVGEYNKIGYDRTKWYCHLSQVDLSEKANGEAKNDKPIPDSKPDSKPYIDACEFEQVWKSINPKLVKSRQGGKPRAEKLFLKEAKKHTAANVAAALTGYYSDRDNIRENYKWAAAITACLSKGLFEGYLPSNDADEFDKTYGNRAEYFRERAKQLEKTT